MKHQIDDAPSSQCPLYRQYRQLRLLNTASLSGRHGVVYLAGSCSRPSFSDERVVEACHYVASDWLLGSALNMADAPSTWATTWFVITTATPELVSRRSNILKTGEVHLPSRQLGPRPLICSMCAMALSTISKRTWFGHHTACLKQELSLMVWVNESSSTGHVIQNSSPVQSAESFRHPRAISLAGMCPLYRWDTFSLAPPCL